MCRTGQVVVMCAAVALLGGRGQAQSLVGSLAVNGGAAETYISQAEPERRYQYGVRGGRSYCVEAIAGRSELRGLALRLDITNSAGTAIGSTIFTASEPDPSFGARFCYIATAFELNVVKVTTPDFPVPTTPYYFRLRVVETTHFCRNGFVDPTHDAFLEFKNTNSVSPAVPLTLTITLRDAGGVVVGNPFTYTASASEMGSISVKNTFGLSAGPGGYGSLEISHDRAPGILVANVTSWSPFAGVNTWMEKRCELRQQPVW